MRVSHFVVYDKVLAGTSPVYTAAEFNEALARPNRWALFLSASKTSGTAPTLTVTVESSPDDGTWGDSVTLVDALALSLSSSTSNLVSWMPELYKSESIRSRFIRLRFSLGGTGPSTTLKAWVTGRTDAQHYYQETT